MEGLIFAVADERFFYRDLEKIDTPTIDAHADDDDGISLQEYSFAKDQLAKNPKGKTKEMRKIAYRYRRIRELFSTPNAPLRMLLSFSSFYFILFQSLVIVSSSVERETAGGVAKDLRGDEPLYGQLARVRCCVVAGVEVDVFFYLFIFFIFIY